MRRNGGMFETFSGKDVFFNRNQNSCTPIDCFDIIYQHQKMQSRFDVAFARSGTVSFAYLHSTGKQRLDYTQLACLKDLSQLLPFQWFFKKWPDGRTKRQDAFQSVCCSCLQELDHKKITGTIIVAVQRRWNSECEIRRVYRLIW